MRHSLNSIIEQDKGREFKGEGGGVKKRLYSIRFIENCKGMSLCHNLGFSNLYIIAIQCRRIFQTMNSLKLINKFEISRFSTMRLQRYSYKDSIPLTCAWKTPDKAGFPSIGATVLYSNR